MVAANKRLLKLVRRLAIRDEQAVMRRRAGLVPAPVTPRGLPPVQRPPAPPAG